MLPLRKVLAAAALGPALLAATPAPFDGTDLVVAKRAVQGTVNGLADANEYVLAPTAISGGLGSFQVQTYRSADGSDEEIQFRFTVTDPTFSNNDAIRIYFDVDHDHTSGARDRQVEIRRNGTATVGGVNLSGPPSGAVALPGAQLSVQSNPADWVAEVKLEAADLGLNGIPSLMGLYVQVIESNTLSSGSFPGGLVTTVATWANLKTRFPIDFMIVLDQSGSMLSNNKWTNAKRAADLFANTMAILGEPAHFADRLGLVNFKWLCSGADQTATAKPLAALGAFPVGVYTSGVIDPIGNNCTPIGRGLNVAFGAANLDATQPDATVQRDRGVLLLSDGLQNRPGSTILPADAGYDPCPAVAGFNPCPAGTVSNVAVSTVAFGEGTGDVDEGLLNEIRGRYLGDFATGYDLTSNVEDLKETFINGLEDFYTTNLVYSGVNPVSFPVDPGNDKLIAIASWTDAAQAENIALQRDDGGFATVACSVPAAFNTSVGFAVCAIDNPASGTWRVVAADGTFNNPMNRLFVLVDLQLRARFGVEPAQPGTGDALLLTAELRDRGRPVLHSASTPVRVTVRVETPEEGLGTFASTHDPQSCRTVQPQLPPVDPVITRTLAARDPVGAAGAQTPFMAAAAAASTATGDPQPPLYALVARLLEACGREGLARGQEPGLELRDDGAGGDAVAGDGVYSLRYTGADVAGSYVFRFEVDGTTEEGERFARTRRTGRYVRVQPTAAASQTGSRVLQQSGSLVVREFFLLPRDRFGGYLGPGMAHKVDFVKQAGPGTFAGPVIDYGNGWYARRIQYDPAQGQPVVTPTVYGRPLAPAGRPGGRGRFELGVFAGATLFPDELGLEDGLAAGARLGFRLGGPLVLEAEGAATLTEDAAGSTGRAVQLFGNARLDLAPGASFTPFLRAGAGQVLFRGFTVEDEAAAYHAGGGLTAWLSSSLGVRAEARALRIEDVFGAGTTDSYQATAGVVIRF